MPSADHPDLLPPESTGGSGDGTNILSFPPSIAQEAFYYLEKLNPGTAPFNIAVRFHLQGPLDVDILKRTFEEMIARHEALRTCFEERDGELFQVVHPVVEMPFAFEDLSSLNPSTRDIRLAELGRAEAIRPFPLSEAPLLRALLVKTAGDDHLLHLSIHHTVADGWSIGIITNELAVIYQALTEGVSIPLEPLPIQYADFTIWQTEFLESDEMGRQMAFWKRKLDGLAEMDFPTDHPRPLVKRWNGNIVSRILPDDLVAKLESLARERGATLFQVFLTTFQILLHRHTGSEDIAIGTPVAGRDRAELEPLIGTFINSVLLRSRIVGGDSFLQTLDHVRTTALEALSHHDLPFESLVRAVRPQRDTSRNPLFQINITHQRDFVKPVEFAGIRLTALPSLSSGAIFDLHFFMIEREGSWRVSCDYNTDLFEEGTALRLLERFVTLLEGAAKNPKQSVRDLPLMARGEYDQILAWRGETSDYPRAATLGSLFLDIARAHPEKIAIIQGDQKFSYDQLHAYASRLAQELRTRGIGAGDVIGITTAHAPETIGALLGIALSGAAYVPIALDHPLERIRFLMDDTSARMLLVEPACEHTPESLERPILRLEPMGTEVAPVECVDPGAESHHAAYILYTSGSTGSPKGVVVPHRAVIRLVRGANYMDFRSDEIFLLAAPLSFDASTLEVWGPLLNGATLVIPDSGASGLTGLVQVARTVREQGVTTLWLTAGLFQVMVDEHMADMKGLRNLLAGGDVLSVAHVRRAFEALPKTRLINGYGPTENTTFTTCHTITQADLDGAPIPIGRPIANTTVYILDAHGQLAPIGVPGEILTGGDGLARGYLNNTELTSEKFIPNPLPGHETDILYRTGDRGRWRANGTIEFLGRSDRQIKIRGVRIEPEEVETALLGHPLIAACRVGIHGMTADEKVLVAWVCPKPGMEVDRQELADYLSERLPPFLRPDAIVTLDHLPLTPNGKIDIEALPAPETEARPHSTPPVTETEKQLAAIWRDLLNISTIGRDDNFFYLGGHSLLALKLFSRIHRESGVLLPLATLLKAPTLRSLALVMDAGAQSGSGPRAVLATLQRAGHHPPLFCVHGGDGGVIFYRNLLPHFQSDRPLIAIESPGMQDKDATLPTSVEEVARAYLDQIRRRQGAGPYFLAGYSFGGLVAYEMARILQGQGESIAFLGLFDAMNPSAPLRPYTLLERVARRWKQDAHLDPIHRARQFLTQGLRRILRDWSSNRAPKPTQEDTPNTLFADVSITYRKILRDYHPLPYAGKITLFRAAVGDEIYKQPSDYGWRALVESLEIAVTPGRHLTIFDPENVESLARELNRHLERAPAS